MVIIGSVGMNREKEIESLVEKYYQKFDFLQQEPFSFWLNQVLSLFLNSDLSIEEIEIKILEKIHQKEKEMGERFQPEKVQKNHILIYSQLEKIVSLLKEQDVEYYVGGALSGYLFFQEESGRCHDDIDFLVNEEQLDKFQEVCEHLGLSFHDNRYQTSRVLKNGIPSGEHEVMATSSDSDFHIGVFCFERLLDGTVVIKGYYHDDDNHPCCREEVISSDLADAIFRSKQVDFRGYPLSVVAPEYIYLLKQYTHSEKDKIDMDYLEKHINPDYLSKLEALQKTDRCIQHVILDQTSTLTSLKSTEIAAMLDEKEEKELENEKVLEKTILPKIKENGFAHKYILFITMLIVIVLLLIVIVILKWTQKI